MKILDYLFGPIKDPFERMRNTHSCGKVLFQIQIRERGISFAAPDGVNPVPTVDMSLVLQLYYHLIAERCLIELPIICALSDDKVLRWKYYTERYNITPHLNAFNDLMKEELFPKEIGKEFG